MKKIIFLDRDGVINNNKDYYIYTIENCHINNGVIDALSILKKYGYEFIIISNQSGIAKGIYSINDVERIHKYIENIFNQHDIHILEYYYCTHHPDITKCLCRKPSPLLFEKAIARFDIDIKHSWMIGDMTRDIEAAQQVGIRGILIEPNSNLLPIIQQILENEQLY